MASEASVRTEPQILSQAGDSGGVRIELRIPEDLCYFEGHFPKQPILPGVVQLNWAIEFGRRHFSIPSRFTHLSNVKFMRVIVPGKQVLLSLRFERGELTFEYRSGESVCSSGGVGFADATT